MAMSERRRMHIQSENPTETLCKRIASPMRYTTAIEALITPDRGGWCEDCRTALHDMAESYINRRNAIFQHDATQTFIVPNHLEGR